MAQTFKLIQKWRYEVFSPETCTVSDAAGLTYGTASAGAPLRFTAQHSDVTLSSDKAMLFDTGQVADTPTVSTTGEPMVNLADTSLTLQHHIWYCNTSQAEIAVQPGAWRNEVMTCYLKTSIPVALSGVIWLYGEPAMAAGYTYVIALQQIDASTVLANLAYTLPQ